MRRLTFPDQGVTPRRLGLHLQKANLRCTRLPVRFTVRFTVRFNIPFVPIYASRQPACHSATI